MTEITKHLPMCRNAIAPDGSDVRILLSLPGGGMAHLGSRRNVYRRRASHCRGDLVFYRRQGRDVASPMARDITVDVYPVAVAITIGTRFQFRSFGYEPLSAVGVTMPPWPGEVKRCLSQALGNQLCRDDTRGSPRRRAAAYGPHRRWPLPNSRVTGRHSVRRERWCSRRPSVWCKTQTVLPSAETAAMLFLALLSSGQITMRKVDRWQTLAEKLDGSRSR